MLSRQCRVWNREALGELCFPDPLPLPNAGLSKQNQDPSLLGNKISIPDMSDVSLVLCASSLEQFPN